MPEALTPPCDLEAEAAFLGSILLDPAELAHVLPLPRPEDFYASKHAALWRCMVGLHGQGTPPDALLVYREAERRGLLEEIGGREYPATLSAEVSSPVHAGLYAKVVLEKAKARALIRVAQTLEAHARSGADADVGHRKAQEALYALSMGGGAKGAAHISEAVYAVLGHLEGKQAGGLVVPTGLGELDDYLSGGLHGGELILAAARPGVGKTTLALNAVRNASAKGFGSIIFSLEMTADSLARNVLAAEARVSGERMRKGGAFLGDAGLERVRAAATEIGNRNIHISDTSVTDVSEIRSEVLRCQAKHGISLVVVDYVQLLAGGDEESRQQVVDAISRNLKLLAKDTGLPILAMSQLNRDSEKREGGRPRLADLRESGGLEANADTVLLMHRPWMQSRLEAEQLDMEIIVGKQRHGATGSVHVEFHGENLLICDRRRPQADFHAGPRAGMG